MKEKKKGWVEREGRREKERRQREREKGGLGGGGGSQWWQEEWQSGCTPCWSCAWLWLCGGRSRTPAWWSPLHSAPQHSPSPSHGKTWVGVDGKEPAERERKIVAGCCSWQPGVCSLCYDVFFRSSICWCDTLTCNDHISGPDDTTTCCNWFHILDQTHILRDWYQILQH